MKNPKPVMDNEVTLAVKAIAAAVEQIAFNYKWCVKGNYLDGAVSGEQAPVLKVGEVKTSTDNAGRVALFIGTELGNVLVFTGTAHGVPTTAWQCSPVMDGFIKDEFKDVSGIVTLEFLNYLINDPVTDNIGLKFQAIEKERHDVLIGLYNGTQEVPAAEPVAEPAAAAPEAPKAAAAAPEAEAPKAAETKSETNSKEAKMKSTTTAKTESKDLTAWGVFWRVSGVAVLIIAIIVAVAFGLHFGAAYIAGLGIGEGVKIALTYLLTISGYLSIGFTVAKGVDYITSLFSRRKPVVSAATPAPAAA